MHPHSLSDFRLRRPFRGYTNHPPVIDFYEQAITAHTGLGMEILRVDGTEDEEQVFEKVWSRLKGLPIVNM